MKHSLLLLCVFSLLVGCSNDRGSRQFGMRPMPPIKPKRDIPPGVSFSTYLEKFPVYDRDGEERDIVPIVAQGIRPLGVMVSSISGGLCSASHIVKGYVVVAAHCVEYPGRPYSQMVPKEVGLIYFNKIGLKKHTFPIGYAYAGKRTTSDMAILKISDEAAEDWDVSGGSFLDTSVIGDTSESAIERTPPYTFQVTVWAFDPVQRLGNYQYGKNGMQFHPRQCTASRTRFRLQGRTADETIKPVSVILSRENGEDSVDTNMHFVFDRCTSPVIGGNSGGLVTRGTTMDGLVGEMHWKWTFDNIDPRKEYVALYVKGNSSFDVPRLVFRGLPSPLLEIFNTGTTFDSVLKARPTLFGGPSTLSPL